MNRTAWSILVLLPLVALTAPVTPARADVMPCGRCSYDRRASRNDAVAGAVALAFAGAAAFRLARRRPPAR